MKIEFEFNVNAELENAFYAHIEDIRNGSYDHNDLSAYDAQLDEIRTKPAEEWSEATKKDLSVFLMFRAGFQSASGWQCEDFKR
jgi:hypothetical protein